MNPRILGMRDEILQVSTRQGSNADVLIVQLSGPLLVTNLFDFQQTVRSSGAPNLVVDMTHVPYVDSAGVGALVGAYVSYQKDGQQLALAGVNDRVRSLFSMTQVDRFFKSFATVSDAEAALHSAARGTAGQA